MPRAGRTTGRRLALCAASDAGARARGGHTALCEGATRPAGKRAASSFAAKAYGHHGVAARLPVTSPTRAWRGSGSVRPMCWLCCLQPTRAGCLLRSRYASVPAERAEALLAMAPEDFERESEHRD